MKNTLGLLSLCALTAIGPGHPAAQTGGQAAPQVEGPSSPFYNKPLRGAPARRVTGASRGTKITALMIPTIELLAPDGHTGQTGGPTPKLYYFVSGPVPAPVRFTISAAGRAAPVLELDIPSPKAAGVYGLPLADFGARLEPDTVYTWSVSATLSPEEPSNDIVASASLLRIAPDPGTENAVRAAPPIRRATMLAQAGLWYDAVAAASEAKDFDRHAALDALIEQAGLTEAAEYDRRAASGSR
jgi:hypothetical protein